MTCASVYLSGCEEVPVTERPLEENLNRLVVDGDVARSVDEAIAVLRCVSGCLLLSAGDKMYAEKFPLSCVL